MSVMTVRNLPGIPPMEWDPADAAQVEETRRRFDEIVSHSQMLGRTCFAYRSSTGLAQDSEQIREFDPEAESIVIVGPLAGG